MYSDFLVSVSSQIENYRNCQIFDSFNKFK